MPRPVAGLPRVRPLTAVARRLQLLRAWSFEAARLRKAAELAAPGPDAPEGVPVEVDAEESRGATVVLPFETMAQLVHGREAA